MTKRERGSTLQVKRRPWSQIDKQYWDSYFIPKKTLTKFDVSPIQYAFLNDKIIWEYSDDCPMYVYKIYNGLKVYRPLANKTSKWLSSCSQYDIQGFKQLPDFGDLLVITKSLKDVMVLHELGYTAIAPQAESHDIPEHIITHLKERYHKLLLLYDRDKTGMKGVRKLMRKYDLDFAFIPKKYKCKDISDFVRLYGIPETEKILKKLTNGRN